MSIPHGMNGEGSHSLCPFLIFTVIGTILLSAIPEHTVISRSLPVSLCQVVGFGEEENDQAGQSSCGPNPAEGDEDQGQALKTSSYGEVSKLTFLPASPMLADATLINDIRAFTSSLTLYPYHKILK